MVSVVLHNACLKMDEEGVGLGDITSTKGVQRWLGRGGIALGGAASLLVGAVFGGLLTPITALFPPAAAGANTPVVSNPAGGAATPIGLASDSISVAAIHQMLAAAPTQAVGAGGGAVAVPTLPIAVVPTVATGSTGCTGECGSGTDTGSSGADTGGEGNQQPPQQQQSDPTVGQQLASTVESAVAPVTTATGTSSVVDGVASSVGSTVTALTSPLTATATSTSSSTSASSSGSSSASGLGQTITTIVGGL